MFAVEWLAIFLQVTSLANLIFLLLWPTDLDLCIYELNQYEFNAAICHFAWQNNLADSCCQTIEWRDHNFAFGNHSLLVGSPSSSLAPAHCWLSEVDRPYWQKNLQTFPAKALGASIHFLESLKDEWVFCSTHRDLSILIERSPPSQPSCACTQ